MNKTRNHPRCPFCKNGKLPTTIRVTVPKYNVSGKKEPLAVISCPNCQISLSYTSARKLNHALLTFVRFE